MQVLIKYDCAVRSGGREAWAREAEAGRCGWPATSGLEEAGRILPYRFQREHSPADSLILNFSPARLEDENFCCVKLPSLCDSVRAALRC